WDADVWSADLPCLVSLATPDLDALLDPMRAVSDGIEVRRVREYEDRRPVLSCGSGIAGHLIRPRLYHLPDLPIRQAPQDADAPWRHKALRPRVRKGLRHLCLTSPIIEPDPLSSPLAP